MRSDNKIKKDLEDFTDSPQNDAMVELLMDIRSLLCKIMEELKQK